MNILQQKNIPPKTLNQLPFQNMLSEHNNLHKLYINVYLMLTKVFVTEGHVVFLYRLLLF